jgi:maltooligosyltrehalose trehalohydrolase
LRRETPAFRAQRRGVADGSVLSADAFALRFLLGGDNDRVLVVNMGRDLSRPSFAEPLLAPPRDREWVVEWSSEDPKYGGSGIPELWPDKRWCIPGESALVLAPIPKGVARNPPVRRRTA